MDAIGAAASLITLFTTCVQCFEYFQAARSFHEKYDLLLVKLDVEKTKLLAWGDAMGILDPENEDGVSKIRDIPIIMRLLEKIRGLLDNANDLREKYGVKEENWEGSTRLRTEDSLREGTALTVERIRGIKVVSRYSRFWKKFEGLSRPAPLVRFVWAIQDESRFEKLIDELRGLVDGLNALAWIISSAKVDEQHRKMREDIESIPSLPNLSNLRLVEAACSGRYSSWSEAASQKIDASELGTRGRLDIEEWNQQIGDDEDGGSKKPKSTQATKSGSYVNSAGRFTLEFSKLLFMMTESCLNMNPFNTSKPCQDLNFASDPIWNQKGHIASSTHQWNMGRRISDDIERDVLPIFDQADLYDITKDDQGERVKISRRVAKVWIYCGPCSCLLTTARRICEAYGVSKHLEMAIRVDHRLRTSCCSSSTSGLDRVKDLLEGSEVRERDMAHSDDFGGFLDRPWMERAIIRAENEQDTVLGQPETPNSHRGLLKEYSNEYDFDRRSYMTLIMGECDYLLPSIECLDCIFNPHIPAVGEVWQVWTTYGKEFGWHWRRKLWGRYTLSSEACKQRTELSQLRRTLGTSVDTTTENTNTPSGPLNSLASPPASVGSKRQRSASPTQSDAVGKRVPTKEANGGLNDL